uniref:Uncharacterized protein n=1 Tax=Sphaerodactylus townsendi TaxID=933632 RepID=A0ACB8FH73_9SAUR
MQIYHTVLGWQGVQKSFKLPVANSQKNQLAVHDCTIQIKWCLTIPRIQLILLLSHMLEPLHSNSLFSSSSSIVFLTISSSFCPSPHLSHPHFSYSCLSFSQPR